MLPYVGSRSSSARSSAALIVRWNYTDLHRQGRPRPHVKTQGIFSTLPGNGASGEWTALRDQIVGTAILLFLIFAITNAVNNPPLANLAPLIIGLLVVAIGMAWGTNAGYAINPARDFGPRAGVVHHGLPGRDVLGQTDPNCTSGCRSSLPSSAA